MSLPRFEWYGWAFYWKHCKAVTIATWYQDLRPVRALLAAISLVIGVFFVLPFSAYQGEAYRYLREWVHEGVFGTAFVLHGFGLLWRIYAPARIDWWARIFGAIGIALYVAYPLALMMAIGRVTGQGLALLVLAFANAWCARRIGSGEDRSGS